MQLNEICDDHSETLLGLSLGSIDFVTIGALVELSWFSSL